MYIWNAKTIYLLDYAEFQKPNLCRSGASISKRANRTGYVYNASNKNIQVTYEPANMST
jgi:hypothetical protein